MKTILPDIRLLDVGGTFIKCDDGRQVPVASGGSREEISAALREAVGPAASLKGLGVSIPGPFDYRNGIFLMKHKYAAVYGQSFRELAGLPAELPLRFLHDVNAPLLGAVKLLGLEDKNVALVTLGTGLGFSFTVRGELQCNQNGSPLKGLWNLPYGDGILEDRISARGISAAYAASTGETGLTAYDVSCRARSGDAAALEVYVQTGEILGQALDRQARELSLDVVLMGGQISKSLDLMENSILSHLSGTALAAAPEGVVFKGLASLF